MSEYSSETQPMKFIIRDDDVNYFSTPDTISKWYADIFSMDIPVGFSAIPFVKSGSDVYTNNAQKSTAEFPIHENTDLVSFITNTSHIEILQHGTTHENKQAHGRTLFEYAGLVSRDEAKRGREELERAFGAPVTVFVPPHDWIDSSGILSVEHAGMNIIRGRGAGLRNWIFRIEYISVCIQMLLFRIAYVFLTKRGLVKPPAYPRVLNFGRHKEMCSYRLEDADVFAGLEYASRTQGIFVLVTHLHYYDTEKKTLLLKLIARAKELDAEFVRPSSIFI